MSELTKINVDDLGNPLCPDCGEHLDYHNDPIQETEWVSCSKCGWSMFDEEFWNSYNASTEIVRAASIEPLNYSVEEAPKTDTSVPF